MSKRARNVPEVQLGRALERSVFGGHPWLYRDSLRPFSWAPGTEVRVLDRRGRCIARGLCDAGPIGVRVFATRDRALDDGLLAERIAAGFRLRERIVPPDTDAYRLLHGEGDLLPGVVLDRYADRAVLRLDGAGAETLAERLTRLLREPLDALGVRSLLLRTGRKGQRRVESAFGPEAPEEVQVREYGMRLCANLLTGQKTGLFLDHRHSRRRVRELARGMRVLNLYGYTGGFSVAAGLGGAVQVTTVDVAAPALALAERAFIDNDLPASIHRVVTSDVRAYLERVTAADERFELIVADPPNLAPSEAAKPAAMAAYEQLHASALRLLAPGGLYLAASCSSHVRSDDFLSTLRGGARLARKQVQLLEQTGAPADHPRLPSFPEGDYLKVTLLRLL